MLFLPCSTLVFAHPRKCSEAQATHAHLSQSQLSRTADFILLAVHEAPKARVVKAETSDSSCQNIKYQLPFVLGHAWYQAIAHSHPVIPVFKDTLVRVAFQFQKYHMLCLAITVKGSEYEVPEMSPFWFMGSLLTLQVLRKALGTGHVTVLGFWGCQLRKCLEVSLFHCTVVRKSKAVIVHCCPFFIELFTCAA